MRVILLIVKYNDSQRGSSKDKLGTRLEGRMNGKDGRMQRFTRGNEMSIGKRVETGSAEFVEGMKCVPKECDRII